MIPITDCLLKVHDRGRRGRNAKLKCYVPKQPRAVNIVLESSETAEDSPVLSFPFKENMILKILFGSEQILHHFKNDPGILLAQPEGKQMGKDLVAERTQGQGDSLLLTQV